MKPAPTADAADSGTADPTPLGAASPGAPSATASLRPPASDGEAGAVRQRRRLPRIEDWLLAAWVAVVAPPLLGAQAAGAGPWDGGRPLDGVIGIAAVTLALVCLALPPGDADVAGFVAWGAVGPFVGGALLVGISSVIALGLDGPVAMALAVGVGALAIVVHLRARPAPMMVRRALVTPYVLVTGTMFVRVLGPLVGGQGVGPIPLGTVADLQAAAPILGFLVAFSAIYYAMLVYAPRTVAGRDGGLITWLIRYALFVVGVVFGLTWLAAIVG